MPSIRPLPPPDIALVDPASGLIEREWYEYFRSINQAVTGAIKSITLSVRTVSAGVGGTVTGDGFFPIGTSRTVVATAAGGHSFTNWTEGGAVVSASASFTFTLTSNRTLVANFT